MKSKQNIFTFFRRKHFDIPNNYILTDTGKNISLFFIDIFSLIR